MDGWMDGDGESCICDCWLVICRSGTDKEERAGDVEYRELF